MKPKNKTLIILGALVIFLALIVVFVNPLFLKLVGINILTFLLKAVSTPLRTLITIIVIFLSYKAYKNLY